MSTTKCRLFMKRQLVGHWAGDIWGLRSGWVFTSSNHYYSLEYRLWIDSIVNVELQHFSSKKPWLIGHIAYRSIQGLLSCSISSLFCRIDNKQLTLAKAINYATHWKWRSFIHTVLILTHWGRVTHICVGNLTIIGSDNGLSPGRRQAII